MSLLLVCMIIVTAMYHFITYCRCPVLFKGASLDWSVFSLRSESFDLCSTHYPNALGLDPFPVSNPSMYFFDLIFRCPYSDILFQQHVYLILCFIFILIEVIAL